MEDLIYNFLLQSKFPRASILLNTDLLNVDSLASTGPYDIPTFIIVDPETAQPLALIEVVDAVDDDTLKEHSMQMRKYASKLAGNAIQGFLIRVDIRGVTEADQVQFFKIWPTSTLQSLSSKTFPDLGTLRVARMLVDAKKPVEEADDVEEPEIVPIDLPVVQAALPEQQKSGALLSLYFPAAVVLVLALLDSVHMAFRGTPLLSLTQSVLVIGAALLYTVPAALRYIR